LRSFILKLPSAALAAPEVNRVSPEGTRIIKKILEAALISRAQRIRAAVAKLHRYPISSSYFHRVDNHSAAGCLTSTRKRGFSFHTYTLKNIRTFTSSKVISASSKVYLNPDLDKEIIISENRNKPGIYK
jgi:hypothetical protein